MRKAIKYGPSPDWVNECTEEITPLRVRKVPKIVSVKVRITSAMFHTLSMFFFSWIITECKYAVAVNQGIIAAFSTGSQAQYPPHPRTSYAQRPPKRLPTDRKNDEVSAQRRVVRIHTSPSLPVARAAIAKAKGTAALTYPRYKQGGW